MSLDIAFNLHTLIWGTIIVLAVIWFLGLVGRGQKRFLNLVLVVAVALIIYNFFLH